MNLTPNSSTPKISVLILSAFYLPGFKGGGPIRSISNMVDRLGSEIKFSVITGDRDLNDRIPYKGIQFNRWLPQEELSIAYLSKGIDGIAVVGKLIKEVDFDILYLNSFFGFKYSILPLIAMRLGLIHKKKIILAPRGEFSDGALRHKALKKLVFISLCKFAGIHKRVTWHASTSEELMDIQNALHIDAGQIQVARNLTSKTFGGLDEETAAIAMHEERTSNSLRICFLSRITEKKNLDFALRTLKNVRCQVTFTIYGPKESQPYWEMCRSLISELPSNVSVVDFGEIENSKVKEELKSHDLLFFPTLGENYGHVIFEALSAGLPILISDKTPWRNLKEQNLGWDLPLNKMDDFVSAIELYAQTDKSDRHTKRQKCLQVAQVESLNGEALVANVVLFEKVHFGV